MNRKKIIANTLVKNEGRFLWFSVTSIIDYVDKVLIWDTGSNDNTLEIAEALKERYPNKTFFKKYGEISVDEFPKVRQRMLEASDCDWIFVLDGDEVWWEEKIRETVEFVQNYGDNLDTLVHKSINLVGDIFHKRPDKASHYELDGKTGSLNIRFMSRKIPGLNAQKPHGQFGYYNKYGILIQEMDLKRRHHFVDISYLHLTHLTRSGKNGFDKSVPKRESKLKYEFGDTIPLDFYYPEAFFKPKPRIVEDLWIKREYAYLLKTAIVTPFRTIKRKLLSNSHSGY